MKKLPLILCCLPLLQCAACSTVPFWKKPEVRPLEFGAGQERVQVSSQPLFPPVQQVARPAAEAPPSRPATVTDIAKVESGRVTYKKDDITFRIKGDPQLNRYGNNAHALYLCVYQLKDPNTFNQLAEEKGGVAKLLQCSRFDSSVANAKRLVVQPGQEIQETRDRAEGARFIGVTGGYYGTGTEKMSHLAPLAVAKGDFSGNTISIELGPYEIDNVTVE
ncbi:type VI secretion lipoprotein TssJ [Geomonas sp. RF6]|uniref:type VI secretion lipoprotein TssJ n=1 Tax=Geomonas sp. RF6 TaxID=2897342 RepID=UPI001E63F560|nr:type VI secretion lipoprotein TssJ [Geomonas sp. RF6]UFS70725.1 type VI secretion lipoprotein TssJ [Geomonas sp. RF6]